MAPDQQQRLDEIFDRIEETILPSIAIILGSLLETAEAGAAGVGPQGHAAELGSLAQQLELLTREVETMSPARIEAGPHRSADAA